MLTQAAPGRTDLDAHELALLLNAHRARQDERAWVGGQRSRTGGLHMDTRSPLSPYVGKLACRPELAAGRALLQVKRAFGVGTRDLTTPAAPRPVMGR
ncbi:hypothetical protein [Labedaea rhizosphaerae]|uniref:Uncharacterized protein n=1 Tax=Labedaea rhizosphaerae TaxID=598644 RepID=A0A4R6SDV4_LABRH|nr:hypothetical protein EV186_1031141 [Labedaea rhizosphaerae]